MLKFQVKESRWLRGGVDGKGSKVGSQLCNVNGDQCCMGFLAEALGIPHDARLNAFYFSDADIQPYDVSIPEPLRPRLDGQFRDARAHGPLATRIYTANDRVLDDELLPFSNEERKATLKKLFAEADIEVEFVP
jgi:hypothetical protein